jgi:hypothetical protein
VVVLTKTELVTTDFGGQKYQHFLWSEKFKEWGDWGPLDDRTHDQWIEECKDVLVQTNEFEKWLC